LDRLKVAVVGGGPAGLVAARELAASGFEVKVFEEDEVIGRPEHCAGLYSVRGLEQIAGIERRFVLNGIRGAVFTSVRGRTFELRFPNPVAVVADREELDRYLAEQAVTEGADVELGSRVLSVGPGKRGGRSVVVTQEGPSEFDAVVVAEGISRRLTRSIFGDPFGRPPLPVVQLLISGHDLDRDKVHVWFERYLDEYFSYAVPVNEELARVGLASRRNVMELARRFLRERFPRSRVLGYYTHSLWLEGPSEVGLDGSVVLVGDCAGQTKPLTGGGVVIGGICALAAARHIEVLLREGRDGTYRRLVRRIYRDLRWTRRLRDWAYRRIDPSEVVELAAETGLESVLKRVGDMDMHFRTMLMVLPNPRGILFLAGLLRSILF
jgi:digeranylgeranylglycerophospholipid reductase